MDLTYFGFGESSGNKAMVNELGGKGANLCEMASIGLNVPAGVIVPTAMCMEYLGTKSVIKSKKMINDVTDNVLTALSRMQEEKANTEVLPLLSIRSGARVSMPGMMDTVLNVGITDNTINLWVQKLGSRGAFDSWRRLIQMYGNVVKGIKNEKFEEQLQFVKNAEQVTQDSEISVEGLQEAVKKFKWLYYSEVGYDFPDTLYLQVKGAIEAVWLSWNGARAKHYRKMMGYPDDWGTAVNVQAMVFGNKNDKSCSGVMFTRNPIDGTKELFGEFLPNAQGEDVVAGIRTPESIATLGAWNGIIEIGLEHVALVLEKHYKDMQDIEFTVQDGELFILQTRRGKRSSEAAFQIALDFHKEGVVAFQELKKRLSVKDYLGATKLRVAPEFKTEPLLVGIPAGGGVVTGTVCLTSESAVALKDTSILVRKETTPDDIAGMEASVGILTSTGGMTSHAAVVARGMNKTCVVGAIDMVVGDGFVALDNEEKTTIHEGETITIDGETGHVWVGDVPVISGISDAVQEVLDIMLDTEDDVIQKGRSKGDIFGESILVPFSWYGLGAVDRFVTDVRNAVSDKLSVYVSVDGGFDAKEDLTILGLFGPQADLTETVRDALIEASVYDKVTLLESGSAVSLEALLDGVLVNMAEVDMIRVCGSVKAYKKLRSLMESVGGGIKKLPMVTSKFSMLGDVLLGGS